MSPRKAVKHELTREMILNVARKLFATEGYSHVSMRKIAKELDYSHGALYYHFQNKAELFSALVKEDFSLLDEKFYEVMKRDIGADEKLQSVLLTFIEFGLTYPNHYEVMFLTKDKEVKFYHHSGPEESYKRFAEALSTLSKTKLSISEAWSIFLSLHGFVAHYSYCEQSFEEVKDMAKAHVMFLLKKI
ncbi:TetR/AcrR family transcriptional regulator [Priestia endophytica]|uniref:TetR/AcrR family transcriptional regulator n=1 Tax=Priestia endophytica TaxID=135735 RepID=UPI00227F014F|nr:TetR/AcrR family transcriptional regulator [Priestia endophytica]MCY8232039.1 TetR/AcrR family transcriptional regulator [Priestia endophytica]